MKTANKIVISIAAVLGLGLATASAQQSPAVNGMSNAVEPFMLDMGHI